MGVIGKRTDAGFFEVRTNRLEDFLLNTTGKLFGHKLEWKLVDIIRERKLRKQR